MMMMNRYRQLYICALYFDCILIIRPSVYAYLHCTGDDAGAKDIRPPRKVRPVCRNGPDNGAGLLYISMPLTLENTYVCTYMKIRTSARGSA